MIDLYDDRPDLYDLLHDGLSDLPFYTGLAGRLIPANGAVLELGCGSGRVMEALLAAHPALRATGLDAAPPMLARAARRLARFGSRARLLEGDMCAPGSIDERYDLIVIAVNTFMHLHSHAAQHACLQALATALHPDGAAIIDLANPFHTLALPQGSITLRRQVYAAERDREVTVTGTLEVDPTAPGLTDSLFFDEVSPDGALRRYTAQVDLRLVFMPELELLLAAVGLGIADAYGDYDLGPYHATAERMIVVVRRYQDGAEYR